MKKARHQVTRRDRRKAKASNWRREGKVNSSKVGHGGGIVGQTVTPNLKVKPKTLIPIQKKKSRPGIVSLSLLQELNRLAEILPKPAIVRTFVQEKETRPGLVSLELFPELVTKR